MLGNACTRSIRKNSFKGKCISKTSVYNTALQKTIYICCLLCNTSPKTPYHFDRTISLISLKLITADKTLAMSSIIKIWKIQNLNHILHHFQAFKKKKNWSTRSQYYCYIIYAVGICLQNKGTYRCDNFGKRLRFYRQRF